MGSQLNEVQKLQKIAGLLNESDLNELSPQLRNASAKKAADKYRFSNALTAPIKNRQYNKFKEMPPALKAIGEKLGEEIALENQYSYDGISLVKAIHDTKGNAMGQDDFIRYKVFLGKGSRFFEVIVDADAEEPIPTEGSVRLSAELARKVLNFIKKLKPEIAGSKPSASSNELEEGKVGPVDVSGVKKAMKKPEVKKMASALKGNKEAIKKLSAALSNPEALAILSKNSISEDEKKYSNKERIARFLKYSGLGSIAGSILGPLALMTVGITDHQMLINVVASAITGALVAAVAGAASTDGYTRSNVVTNESEDQDLESQIAKVLALGKNN